MVRSSRALLALRLPVTPRDQLAHDLRALLDRNIGPAHTTATAIGGETTESAEGDGGRWPLRFRHAMDSTIVVATSSSAGP